MILDKTRGIGSPRSPGKTEYLIKRGAFEKFAGTRKYQKIKISGKSGTSENIDHTFVVISMPTFVIMLMPTFNITQKSPFKMYAHAKANQNKIETNRTHVNTCSLLSASSGLLAMGNILGQWMESITLDDSQLAITTIQESYNPQLTTHNSHFIV